MNFKKIYSLLGLILVLGFLFLFKPTTTNAANNYFCPGSITTNYDTYACKTVVDPVCTPQSYSECVSTMSNESTKCVVDPEHGKSDASYACGGCTHIGTYYSCSPSACGSGLSCDIFTTSVASDPQCSGLGGIGFSWNGCSASCSGWYYCSSCLAYDTSYTGTQESGGCTNNGTRDSNGDSLCCTTTTPTPTPTPTGTCQPNDVCGACSGGPCGGTGTQQCSGNDTDPGWNCQRITWSQSCSMPACPPPPICTPTTSCAAQGATCGSINNGCATVSCGTCPTGYSCNGNTCIAVPPTCTTLTYDPITTVHTVGETKTLTVICSGVAGTPTYNWNAATGTYPSGTGSDTTTTNGITWTATRATMGINPETVAAQVCDSTTGLCSSGISAQIPVIPYYTISGNVFVDVNSDGIDNGEGNYGGAITITSSGGQTAVYPDPNNAVTGSYQIPNLPAGTYTITYTNPPIANGYRVTYPGSAGNPQFIVTVGPSCNANDTRTPANLVAACDPSGNGNVIRLNFAITNTNPWMQSIGGDITGVNFSTNGGFSDSIPSGASQPYASVVPGGASTPGIVFSGANNPNFGQGSASINNWSVGTSTYPEVYTPPIANTIKTSYEYIADLAQTSGITPTDICAGAASCTLSFAATDHGVYRIPQSVTLTGAGSPAQYNFPPGSGGGGQYVILVNGDLNIDTQIHVPVGDSVIFTASGKITVDPSVGETNPAIACNSTGTGAGCDLEGYYSADKNFTIEGTKACPTVDNRLNAAGAIVANASLAGFGFSYNRDLCAADLQYPVFTITERPDFILNSTDFLKPVTRTWQEVAP